MDDEHRPAGAPARLGPELVNRDAVRLRLQPVMARLGHETGGTFDGAAFAIAQGFDVGRAAEQFERGTAAETRSDMLGRSKDAPDDLHSK